MNNCILYYPNIEVPPGPWLQRALLYWDEIGSIVPLGHEYHKRRDIDLLRDNKVLRHFNPEIFFEKNPELVRNMELEIKRIVRNRLDIDKEVRKTYSISLAKGFRVKRFKYDPKAAFSKTPEINILDYLVEKKLAVRKKEEPSRVFLSNETGMIYMSILAKYMANHDSKDTIIGTDIPRLESYNFNNRNSLGTPCYSVNLLNILPTPMPDTPLENILKFKHKRYSELIAFRKILLDYENKLSESKTEHEATHLTYEFSNELRKGVSDLSDLLKDHKISTFWSSASTLVATSSPAWISAIAVQRGLSQNIAGVPADWIIGGSSVIGSISVIKILIDKNNEKRDKLRNSAFSYVYHINNLK
jgi:hypothetical protein